MHNNQLQIPLFYIRNIKYPRLQVEPFFVLRDGPAPYENLQLVEGQRRVWLLASACLASGQNPRCLGSLPSALFPVLSSFVLACSGEPTHLASARKAIYPCPARSGEARE